MAIASRASSPRSAGTTTVARAGAAGAISRRQTSTDVVRMVFLAAPGSDGRSTVGDTVNRLRGAAARAGAAEPRAHARKTLPDPRGPRPIGGPRHRRADPPGGSHEIRKDAPDLALPAARQDRHGRRRGVEAERAQELGARSRARGEIDQRMPDELHRHPGLAVDGFLEGKDDEHAVDEARAQDAGRLNSAGSSGGLIFTSVTLRSTDSGPTFCVASKANWMPSTLR